MKYTEENVKQQQFLKKKDGTDKNPKLSHTSQTILKSYNGWVYHL